MTDKEHYDLIIRIMKGSGEELPEHGPSNFMARDIFQAVLETIAKLRVSKE